MSVPRIHSIMANQYSGLPDLPEVETATETVKESPLVYEDPHTLILSESNNI